MNNRNRIGNRTFAIVIAMVMIALTVVSGVSGATTEEELDLITESFIDSNKGLRLVFKEPLPLPPSIRVWIPEERELRSKVFVLECGSGLNPKSYGNMIEYLLGKGIVVGIFPRENSYDRNTQDQEILRNLDLNDRANNLEEVCEILKFIPDIEVVGHSEGGASVVLMASRVGDSIPGLKVTIIDMNLFCEPGTEEWQNAQICYNASKEMLEQGVYVAGDLTAQRELAYAAKFYSDTDSGFPRPEPLPGNFTYEGLFYFSLIYTGSLPGVLTPLTGLPDGWFYEQGFFEGEYHFSSNPENDTYTLIHTSIETVSELLGEVDSGVSSMATCRDMHAMQCGQYPIDLANIKVNVSLIGTELGMKRGGNDYTVLLLEANGVNVTYSTVEGAHADLTHAENASENFYPIIFG